MPPMSNERLAFWREGSQSQLLGGMAGPAVFKTTASRARVKVGSTLLSTGISRFGKAASKGK